MIHIAHFFDTCSLLLLQRLFKSRNFHIGFTFHVGGRDGGGPSRGEVQPPSTHLVTAHDSDGRKDRFALKRKLY